MVKAINEVSMEGVFELVGLFLILISTFFKLFIADIIRDIAYDGHRIRLEEKLDHIFDATVKHYETSHPEKFKTSSTDGMLDSTRFNWNLAQGESRLDRQSAMLSKIANCSFILGSVFLLLSKCFSYGYISC